MCLLLTFKSHRLPEATVQRDYEQLWRWPVRSVPPSYFAVLCMVLVLQVEDVRPHSESGPYANFEAPGYWWTETPCFSEGFGRVKLDGGYGFIDKTGKVVLQLYQNAMGFSEGLAAVADAEVAGRWGYIDKSGALVVPYQF